MKVDSQNGERQKLKKLYKYNSFKKDSVSEPSAWDLVRLGKIFLGFCNFLARSWQDILPRNAKFCKIFHDHGKANKKNLGFLAKTNKISKILPRRTSKNLGFLAKTNKILIHF